jgi:hypothetical protein
MQRVIHANVGCYNKRNTHSESKKQDYILFRFNSSHAGLYFYSTKYGAKRDLKQFDIFFASELRGSIERVRIKNHGVAFKLNNDINEYVFHPTTSSLNENHIFDHLAAQGDSLIKASMSDTIILVKDQKKYKYTFQQYIE